MGSTGSEARKRSPHSDAAALSFQRTENAAAAAAKTGRGNKATTAAVVSSLVLFIAMDGMFALILSATGA